MGRGNIVGEVEANREIGWILTSLIVALTTTIVFSIWSTVSAINDHDGARNRVAITAALEVVKGRMLRFAENHNSWDDELLEDWRPGPNASLQELASGDAADFDAIWVIDRAGKARMKITAGNAVRHHAMPAETSEITQVEQMFRDLRKDPLPPSGFIRCHDGLAAKALVPIAPDSDFAKVLGGTDGGFLLVHDDITEQFIADTGNLLQIEGLSLHPQSANRQGLEVPQILGGVAAELSWKPNRSTGSLILNQLPWVIAVSALYIFLAFFFIKRASSSFRHLNRVARLDWLTRLPNRWSLQHHLRTASQQQEHMALALIDLDAFKDVNDLHGHGVGDQVLRNVARILRELVPEGGMAARLGGDEFALSAVGPGAGARLGRQLSEIHRQLTTPIEIDGQPFTVGASIGWCLGDPGDSAIELMRRADVAMYQAKSSGKCCSIGYDPGLELSGKVAQDLKNALITAMAEDRIELHYQPILCARTGKVMALEALARWDCPQRGPVPADQFITVAERFGLIGELGERLMLRGCREVAAVADVRLAMNVSASQICRPNFIDEVRDALAESGLPADRLEIEVTETSLVQDGVRARATLDRLSAMGVHTTLDDFGTGYASIGFLRQFRFDALKIDRSIIEDSLTDPSARTVLQACVALAMGLDMEVVAEGVETNEQAALLRALGCTYLQGWLFSRAKPLADLPELSESDSRPQIRLAS